MDGMNDERAKRCTYQGYEFGAVYLDSVCIDGRLYDADSCDDQGRLYEPDEDIPCPLCRPKEATRWWARQFIVGGIGSVAAAKMKAREMMAKIRDRVTGTTRT